MKLSENYIEKAVKALSFIIVPAFIYAKSVITICMALFLILGLLSYQKSDWRNFLKDKQYSFFILLFLMIAVSGVNSDNSNQWLHHLNIKLPFLILPLAFYKFRKFNQSWINAIHIWLIVVLSVAAIPVIINYFIDYTEIMKGMAVGHPIPTPIEHVKYSMFNSYGVVAGLFLVLFRYREIGKFMTYVVAGLIIFLFIYLHLLSVRTGLMITYVSISALICYLIFVFNRKILGIASFVGVFIIAFISITQMPSLKQRIGYMIYDFKQHELGEGDNYSDSDRFQSYMVGIKIFMSSPIIGVGIGDLKDEGIKVYHNELNRPGFHRYPHNQFIYILAGCGLIGLILFLIGFYGPLIANRNYISILLLFLYLNYSLSFLVENSIERSFSLAFFLFFSLTMIHRENDIPEQE